MLAGIAATGRVAAVTGIFIHRIAGGRIASAVISQCRTRYSCNVIDQLPPQVVQRQSPEVDYVSGATQSADASQAGKALYQQVCQACHAAGVLNAPKFGDKEAWAPRLKDPMETVYNYALHGKGAMPPKGGSNASDADVKAAVDYMVSAVK